MHETNTGGGRAPILIISPAAQNGSFSLLLRSTFLKKLALTAGVVYCPPLVVSCTGQKINEIFGISARYSKLSDRRCALPLEAVLAAARGRGGGCGRVWSSGHARAVAETAGCRLGRRRSRRRAPNSAAPARSSSPLIERYSR